jgi:thiol-disulfide isomerase/thioredoxin
MKLRVLVLILVCFSCKNKTEIVDNKSRQIEISSLTKEERMNIVNEGNQIPNGNLKSVNESIIKVESFNGKLLIIDFWATWCSPCLTEAPIFKEIAEKYKDSNAEFISISIDQEFTNWKSYILENNWTGKNYWYGMQEDEPFFSLLYSKHKSDDKEMVLIGLPKYVIISPSGKILSNSDLRPSKPEFELEIKKHLK